ncbi:hypothetical protein [Gillisia sp. JM1]|nr:hypothetical protein [Gillisia sp. JM1]
MFSELILPAISAVFITLSTLLAKDAYSWIKQKFKKEKSKE